MDLAVSKTQGGYELTVTSAAPAFFATVEADCEGRFSDNAFLVVPGEPVVVRFEPKEASRSPIFATRDLHSATYERV